jgi:hypothetical protein
VYFYCRFYFWRVLYLGRPKILVFVVEISMLNSLATRYFNTIIYLFRSVYHSAARNFSYESENGTWNGVIGLLASDQVDVAVGKFAMTSSRLSVASYLSVIFPAK